MRDYPLLECSSVVNVFGGDGGRSGTGPAVCDFGGLLYLFHRADESSTIHYRTSTDGRGWSDDRSLTDRTDALTDDEPVAVEFGGRLYVLFRGADDPGRLEVCSTDGWTWTPVQRIGRGESVRTSTRPSAVVFRGRLHVFFRGNRRARCSPRPPRMGASGARR
ncbi:hypothetical protein ACFQV2_33030 [Actinokineospora soli]|uniref:BNR repeat-like domain-containing protein n=1 Tax=Actinokineospora soli TaxID=1048753 RepID=A0ABW2TWB5_9PSEU